MDELFRAAEKAERILYLADNAGEIVFDRLLIEALQAKRVTVAVRGVPVLNDATLDEAGVAGLSAVAMVVDNGSDAPGTILSETSPAFFRNFLMMSTLSSQKGSEAAAREGTYRLSGSSTLHDIEELTVYPKLSQISEKIHTVTLYLLPATSKVLLTSCFPHLLRE